MPHADLGALPTFFVYRYTIRLPGVRDLQHKEHTWDLNTFKSWDYDSTEHSPAYLQSGFVGGCVVGQPTTVSQALHHVEAAKIYNKFILKDSVMLMLKMVQTEQFLTLANAHKPRPVITVSVINRAEPYVVFNFSLSTWLSKTCSSKAGSVCQSGHLRPQIHHKISLHKNTTHHQLSGEKKRICLTVV